MKIIISPAKNMRQDFSYPVYETLPFYIDKARLLKDYIKTLSYEELKSLLNTGEKLSSLNFERYQEMDLTSRLTPAILAFDGIQYKYMSPAVFEDGHFQYIKEHLLILSGLYGILRPLDGVTPYRLEMQAKLRTDFCSDLYDFWGESIYEAAAKDTDTILNLASEEYSKCVSKYVSPPVNFINVTFGEVLGEKIVEKGVYVKMARGEMVRFMAENNITDAWDITGFDRLGYKFSPEHSSENNIVFTGRPERRR